MSEEILNAFFQIAVHLCKGDTVDETLASVVEFATVFLNCDECCTYVRQGNKLVPWVWKHVMRGSLQRSAISIHDGFAGAVGKQHAPIAVSADSPRGVAFTVFEDWSRNPGETFVCAPLLSRSQVVGALILTSTKRACGLCASMFILRPG